ncbi:branched-chain amino acid ABC transporter permease [Halopenitus persicus]|uniref:Amino acid/amide ABC transporter membrane protein 2, HAAT family n=1 Tax=Halopenitus persicus TaxID=1048396 RepID=A0A1H3LTM5_9EURY|nr:branched-chain amino acid ABC transporter permease [Halopenitus persicus]QHS18098.1 branched-chain amino acid ABC transporter permease [haloarchaeon 3A1-DGR]SDY67897.1 amino acid/amide ABC transporter membrane protein 2, HAAT family [Halopenitus persicus]
MIGTIRDRLNDLPTRQRWALAGVVLLGLLAVPQVSTNFFVMNVFIYAFIFIGLGQSWNVIGGYAGQFSLGHAVMFAVGGYTTAILFIRHGVTPYVGIFAGGFVAAAVGLFLGAATFRLRYHYFAMATLAAALIGKTVGFRWEYINGASGIEYPFAQLGTPWSMMFRDKLPYFYLIGVMALATTLVIYRMDRSKLGMYLRSIDMDQGLARNSGLNVFNYKMYAMGVSSYIAGVFGGLYAQYVLYIDPMSTLRVLRNIDIIIVPIIGGVGTVLGPVVGAFIFIPIREYTRTGLSGGYTGLGWVVVGVVIVLISIYRPGGVLNQYFGRWD